MKKYILVTGGSQGIGLATVKLLLSNGYNVIATYNKSQTSLLDLKKEISTLTIHKVDLKNPKEIEDMFYSFIEQGIKLDAIINSAGEPLYSLLIDTSVENIVSLININLTSQIITSKHAIKNFLSNNGGKIVNISSIWGIYGASCESVYSATKGAIISFTKSIAKEYASAGITATAIAPGPVDTNMLKSFSQNEREDIKHLSSINKIATPEEVANIIFSIIKDNSSLYNGSVIEISGTII